jgi:hypothetical protein
VTFHTAAAMGGPQVLARAVERVRAHQGRHGRPRHRNL